MLSHLYIQHTVQSPEQGSVLLSAPRPGCSGAAEVPAASVGDVVLVVLDHVIGSAPGRPSRRVRSLISQSPSHLLALGKAQGRWVTCLLLRKQFWMTFMIKFAASRSVMLGLNLCLGRDERLHLWESVEAPSSGVT